MVRANGGGDMKRTLIIGLVAILTLVAVSLGISSSTDNTAYAQELETGEVIEKRTPTSKTYYLGNSRYALDSYIGAIHYKDDYADPKEQWKDIDLTWEGNRITKAPYELTLEGNKVTVRDKKTGEISTIELLEIGGIPIPPQVWERSKGLAKAFATDLEIVVGNGSVSFARILKSDKAAVEAKYRITGNMLLRVKASDTEDELPVEWSVKDGTLTETLKPDRPIKYPVRIDPTLEVQVGADTDDAREQESTGDVEVTLTLVGNVSGTTAAERYWGGYRFVSAEFPAQGTTIDVAYLKVYVQTANADDANFNLHFEELAAPAIFTTDAFNITGRDRTEASVAWVANGIATGGAGFYNSPSLRGVGSPIQELFDAYSPTAMVIITRPNTNIYKAFYVYSWGYDDNTKGAILHLEWTEDGVVAPTVTTEVADDIEDTTATGNGTITDTGGENATIHGIEWDIDSGAPYDNDIHTDGDFGLGAFEDSLTGLPTGTTIYCRAYATNTAGTGYGGEVNFLTKPAAPTNVAATDNLSDKVTITWTKSTGATDYHTWRDAVDLGAVGDVDTFNDAGADAPTITHGTTSASDGASPLFVTLTLVGASANNGTSYTYKVVASNATGNSDDSLTDTGYRKVGVLTYQWQRSAGDSDDTFGDIVGATTDPYNDVGAPTPTITPGVATASDGTSATYVTLSVAGEQGNDGAGRYYQCVLSAPDATDQTSGSNRGYRTTGAITYQWQRSATDSNANYAPLGGATTDPYNDTTVLEDEGRWYCCEIGATGAVTQDTTPDRGYLGDSGITTDEAEPLSVGGIILRMVPIVIAGVVCIFVIRHNMDIRNLLFGALVGLLAFIIVTAIIKLVFD